MLAPELIKDLARQLYEARKSRTQLRHFSRQHPGMDIEDGYAIQRAWVQLELAELRLAFQQQEPVVRQLQPLLTLQGADLSPAQRSRLASCRALRASRRSPSPDNAPIGRRHWRGEITPNFR